MRSNRSIPGLDRWGFRKAPIIRKEGSESRFGGGESKGSLCKGKNFKVLGKGGNSDAVAQLQTWNFLKEKLRRSGKREGKRCQGKSERLNLLLFTPTLGGGGGGSGSRGSGNSKSEKKKKMFGKEKRNSLLQGGKKN